MLDHHRFYNVTIILSLFALALAAAPPLAAEADFEPGWQLRFGVIGLGSGLSFDAVDSHGARTRSTNVDAGGGLAVSGEYRYTPRLGFELGLMAAGEVNVDYDLFVTNALGFASLTAGLNVHLTPGSKVDVYAGPLLAYVQYEDLSYSTGSVNPGVHYPWWIPGTTAHISADDDFAVGANLGLDVRFGDSRWLFCAALKYLTADIDGTHSLGGRADIDFDPLIVNLGAGYRF